LTSIKTKLGITTLSGSNTGDETISTIKTKLGITTLSGSNTGDQTSIVGISGTIAQFNAALSDGDFVTGGGTVTGTNTGDETTASIKTKLGITTQLLTEPVNTINDLLVQQQSGTKTTLGYHAAGDGGNCSYVFDPNTPKSSHNGGAIIDPTRTFPSDWTDDTQKTTWYTPTTSGSGCWIAIQSSLYLDGRIYGIKFDNLDAPITDNTIAIQNALDVNDIVFLPSGAYLVSTLNIKRNNKLLSLDGNKIHLYSNNVTILSVSGSSDAFNIEFHGILETMATENSNLNRGLFDVSNFTGSLYGWDISDIEYVSLNIPTIGLYINTSNLDSLYFGEFYDINAKSSKFKSGYIGAHIENTYGDLVITNIDTTTDTIIISNSVILTNMTLEGVPAYTNITPSIVEKLKDNMTILIKYVVGSGVIASLNENFFTVTNVTTTTFQLKNSSGDIVALTGSYITGGFVEVFRNSEIDFSNSSTHAVGASAYSDIGINIIGPAIDITLDNVSGYNTNVAIISLNGANSTSISGLNGYECQGNLIQSTNTTNWRRMYNNTIDKILSIGQSSGGLLLENQSKLIFSNNNIASKTEVQFIDVSDSNIIGNTIKNSTGGNCLSFIGNSSDPYRTSSNNNIFDCMLDSNNSATTSPLIFDGQYANFNSIDRLTLLNGTVVDSPILELNGAANNAVDSWRYATTTGWEATIIKAFGKVSTFSRSKGSYTRTLTIDQSSLSSLKFTLDTPLGTGGQPIAFFNIQYQGHYNEFPTGGNIYIIFGSITNKIADPVFTFTGDGEYTAMAEGTVTLSGGTGTVTTTLRAADDISLHRSTNGTTGIPGNLIAMNRSTGGFDIFSTSNTDTGSVKWKVSSDNIYNIADPSPGLSYDGVVNGKPSWSLTFPSSVQSMYIAAVIEPQYQANYSVVGV